MPFTQSCSSTPWHLTELMSQLGFGTDQTSALLGHHTACEVGHEENEGLEKDGGGPWTIRKLDEGVAKGREHEKSPG